MTNSFLPRFAAALAMLPVCLFGQTPNYHMSGSIQIGGAGGWDYLTADPEQGRLYVSHAGAVEVIDLKTQKPVGRVSGMQRVHGIALAPKLGSGFISDGGTNKVFVFDLSTLKVTKTVATGVNPDGIVYDSASNRVFAFNGRGQSVTAIAADTGKVDGTIALGGKPEFPVSDGQGNVYDNIEDKSEIVQIDSKSLTVKARWSVEPCESPSGLAFDSKNRRLFAVCDNKLMAVVDADNGKVVSTVPVGEGPDAAAFDPGTGLAFSSNGESGTLTVIQQKDADTYSVVANVKTEESARTMTLDMNTHTAYLPSARFAPKAAGATGWPKVVPGSFKVLVVAP